MTFIVIAIAIMLIWYNSVICRIPKTGRAGISTGKEVLAEITNTNKGADRPVTLRAQADGRKFKVKMKPTEAHLWIKGDKIRILIDESDSKKYRVCFNDYFRENESRIRQHASELLDKKVKLFMPSAKLVKYEQADHEAVKNSKLSSQRVFAFMSMMRVIDSSILATAVLAIACLVMYNIGDMKIKSLFAPALVVALMVWYISAAVKECAKVVKEAKEE